MRPPNEQRLKVEREQREHLVRRGRLRYMHMENMPWAVTLLKWGLRATPLYARGRRNAERLQVSRIHFELDRLPEAFDGIRLLLLTDFHIDAFPRMVETILEQVDGLEFDCCILGGDYNFFLIQESGLAYLRMEQLTAALSQRSEVFAILGNHDRSTIAERLEEHGATVLLNDHASLERDGQRLWLVGLDDCHYYQADDLEAALEGVPEKEFKILLCHSPERYALAAQHGFDLYLAGHIHGGQLCLPGGTAVVTYASVPRRLIRGRWRHGALRGYTSRGCGASGIPVRFFCAPEIALIQLHCRP